MSTTLLLSRDPNPSATGNIDLSELTHTAHLLAHLRIAARSVAHDVARLATDLPCSALAGRDSHPLDNVPHFYEMTVIPFPAGQTRLVALDPVLSINRLIDGGRR